MQVWKFLLTVSLVCLFSACNAEDYNQHPAADKFIASVTEQGFPEAKAKALLKDARHQQKIIDAMSRPAEKKLNWGKYRAIFLTQKRIDAGVDFWKQHQADFAKAEQIYQVSAPYILAVLGVETYFGRNTGSYRVLDALATLGFDYPARSKFFLKQLGEFMLMSQEAHIDPLTIKGSYAGAMGLAQFIPSSYRHYAVDFNQDGKTDLNDPADAIGSIGNYFSEHHWQSGLDVAVRINPSANQTALFSPKYTKPSTSISGWKKKGLSVPLCSNKPMPQPNCLASATASSALTPLLLNGADGKEYWLTTDNFYTITRYNHSQLYAMAVFQLAIAIQQAYEAAP